MFYWKCQSGFPLRTGLTLLLYQTTCGMLSLIPGHIMACRRTVSIEHLSLISNSLQNIKIHIGNALQSGVFLHSISFLFSSIGLYIELIFYVINNGDGELIYRFI